MIVNAERIKITITDILGLIASILFLIGINVWFPVCEPTDSGFMSCHWAGEVLKAAAVVFVILAAAHIAVCDGNIKIGMSIASVGFYAFAFYVPGRIIFLCKMSEMRCRSQTQLWTAVFMIILMLISVTDIIFNTLKASEKKHKRREEKE